MNPFKRGDQVYYAESNEYGFVTSVQGSSCFVRFWSQKNPDKLRTKDNSECVAASNLMFWMGTNKPKSVIEQLLESL